MDNTIANASMHTDMASLARLRAQAAGDSPQANKEVARQFEALFIQTMLKAMRDASQLSESTDGQQTRFYQEMFDKQLALDLARRDSVGLAAIVERQLAGQATGSASVPMSGRVQRFTPSGIDTSMQWQPENPDAFIQALWPHASASAKELGVSADVLIAQAALETGWGQKMIHDQQGGNAFNLFGIKADDRWQGEHVSVATIEYRDGIAQLEVAAFRRYDSLQQSMNDYVAFLKQSPRYRPALENAGNAEAYLQALQQAGYATDPAYARKISDILSRESFSQAIADLRRRDDSLKTRDS